MQSLGLEEGEAIEHRMVTNAIEKAQRKVEGRNFDIRKNLLEYDDVSNDQRQVIYQQRDELMAADEIADMIRDLREEIVTNVIGEYIPAQSLEEQWDIAGLEQALMTEFNSSQPLRRWLDEDDSLNEDSLRRRIHAQISTEYDAKEAQWREQGVEIRLVEKQVMLQILDQRWKEHLATMDHLRQGIHLRAYAQKQPKQEYKREAFELFQELAVRHQARCDSFAVARADRTSGNGRRDRTASARRTGEADALHASGRCGRDEWRRRRRSRRTGRAEGGDVRPPRAQSGSQRSVSVRLREEIQALPRTDRLMAVNLPPLGKLASIRGIRIGTANAGIKQTQRDDLVVMSLAAGSRVAGVFTQSSFKAAPVRVCEEHLSRTCAARNSREQRQRKRRNRFRGHRRCAPMLSLGR